MYTTPETYSIQLEDKACCIVGAECEMHCGCGNRNDNSDTRGIERKIGAPFLQYNPIYNKFPTILQQPSGPTQTFLPICFCTYNCYRM